MKNTLQTLQKKRKSKKGFTLMEMLIVVAIIAILVAISIPAFNAQLDNARTNTDLANERAAKAVAVTTFLTEDSDTEIDGYYDADTGKIEKDKTDAAKIKAYGQKQKGKIIHIKIDSSGDIETKEWVVPSTIK